MRGWREQWWLRRLGLPWEFNLRDLLRWCQACEDTGVEPDRWVRVLYKAKMRRVEDQEAVMRLYKEEFEPEYPLEDEGGGLYLATDQVLVAGCVKEAWPVVLTGSSQSGKSSLVTLLASLVGQTVTVLSMNSATDTMELLGGG